MLNRWVETELLGVLKQEGLGCIAFSPLAQGLLTSKYLKGVPSTSRAAEDGSFQKRIVSERNLENVRSLERIAQERGQSLAQMAIAWVLRRPEVTSALIGASRWFQIGECLGALKNLKFSTDELARIDRHALDGGLNIWAESSDHG
jgi:L-glyceraldehyde 3-phosphate reductase